MPKAIDEALDRDEREREHRLSELEQEHDINSLELLQRVYRSPAVPLSTRIRCATAALPFENPKLAVVATVDGNKEFAFQLDQAIERSRRVLMIEAKPIIEANASSNAGNVKANAPSDTTRLHVQGSNGHKPSTLDRRYRRW
jgi:hypothetical protein